MRFFVYKHTCRSTGMSYVGFTERTIEERWREHVKISRYKNPKHLFQRAIKKYGPEDFNHEILEAMTTFKGANQAETLWIKELGTLYPGGYNLTEGGEGGKPSSITRKKMSEAAKKRIRTKRTFSAEAKKNMSEAAKRRPPVSQATRKKMSNSRNAIVKKQKACLLGKP